MAFETGFHKLEDEKDFEAVKAEGFRPSVPAEDHWLGEGVYFFLDPNGHYWAKRWPFNPRHARTDSTKGILKTILDTSLALDLRNNGVRNKLHQIVNRTRLKLKFAGMPISDGAVFKVLFADGGAEELCGFAPTCIVANFDRAYEDQRVYKSAAFIHIEEMEIKQTAQIQACVINQKILGNFELCA